MTRPAIIFGDVHGDSQKLRRLLNSVSEKYGTEVDLYSVGDLVDRGPDSSGVLDLCIEAGVQGVCGNHELWLLEVLRGATLNFGVYSPIMGGRATVTSYGISPETATGELLREKVPQAHKDFLQSLRTYRFLAVGGKRYVLTHAGIQSDTYAGLMHEVEDFHYLDAITQVQQVFEYNADLFFWVGAQVRESAAKAAKVQGLVQVFGHTILPSVLNAPHCIALDTGCGTRPTGSLSAVALLPDGSREFIQIRD